MGGVIAAPEGETQVVQHVDAFEGAAGGVLAQVGLGVHQLGVLGKAPAGDGAHVGDGGIR
jgi:hypothetical protein